MAALEATLRFVSSLPSGRREELESLLFFNPAQAALREAISRSVETYGSPQVLAQAEQITVGIEGLPGLQALFALHGPDEGPEAVLAGVILHARLTPEQVLVLHMAVAEHYCPAGRHGDLMVALRLIAEVRQAARRLRGVRSLSVLYGRGGTIEMRV